MSAQDSILKLLRLDIQPAQRVPRFFEISLTTGAAAQKLFEQSLKVRLAIIQNISTETVSIRDPANPPTVTSGTLLNPAVAGEGGGSVVVNNIDLSKVMFVRTTSGVSLSIYAEFPAADLNLRDVNN